MEGTQKRTPPKPKRQLGDVHIIIERCKGCEICVEFCPTDVLKMSNGLTEKGYHYPELINPQWCSACKLCELYCPDFAIYVTKTNNNNGRGNAK